MTDKKEENSNSVAVGEQTGVSNATGNISAVVAVPSQANTENGIAASAAEHEKTTPFSKSLDILRPKMSDGEKAYDAIVYKGINYWLNLGISLVAVDYFTHGKGRPIFETGLSHVNSTVKAAQIDKMIGPKAAARAAEVGLGTATINFGGNVILIPTKIMEDNKRNIVHWLNKNVYKDAQLAPDGHEKTADEIYVEKEQPRQSWPNIIWRRIQAMSSTIVTGITLDRVLRKKLPDPHMVNNELITHKDGQEVFKDWIISGTNKGFGAIGAGKIAANATFQRYMNYAALDSIYTWMTSKVMELTNGAKKVRTPGEQGDEIDPPGIIATDEIVMLPNEKNVAKKAPNSKDQKSEEKEKDGLCTPCEGKQKLEKYKKQISFAPAGRHTDMAKSVTPSLSLAP